MRTITRCVVFNAPASEVFSALDDLGATGTHMTTSSTMMMGSKLTLTYLSKNKTGPDCKYHWEGKMMGIPMDFTVLVTKWIRDKQRSGKRSENPG